ncbi:MAG: PadR family transcriptional regulator [Faecalibacterium sp.]|nr:PadR family transcriptional regulator [Ruminococcus sp.]MCM1392695.1 PadR family transcriptional regulator [Ruminococcus sp.]MCM1486378.1 PadR family transcriptional regulator [Faecalibacterium sp.]
MNIKKELSKGSSSLLVLSVIAEGDKYGYQIIKEIEIKSEFVFSFKEGTLYPILHTFEKDGYLKSYWEETDSARKRKYYHITKKGLKLLDQSKEEWTSYSDAVNKVLSGGVSHAAT